MKLRRINKAGRDLIQGFEGCSLKAYQDIGGVWTIGFGHTGSEVVSDMEITRAEAERFLEKDLEYFCQQVGDMVKVKVNDNQFAALVSFAYNCGVAALRGSTLMRKLNEGQDPSQEFVKWNKVKTKVIAGLTRRREAEQKLFLTPVSDDLGVG